MSNDDEVRKCGSINLCSFKNIFLLPQSTLRIIYCGWIFHPLFTRELAVLLNVIGSQWDLHVPFLDPGASLYF